MARRGKKRKFRDNIWFGNSKGHAKAARKGWKHRGHKRSKRCRDNPGAVSIKSPVKALTSAFNIDLAKRAGFVIGGNLLTTFVADKIIGSVDMLKSNKAANVLVVLGMAGVAGAAAHRFMPSRGSDVLLGGMLAGLTRTLKMVWPSQFGSLGDDLEQDMEGLYDYVDPRQIMAPMGTRGFGDYGTVPQATGAMRLDGISADMAVAEEIASQA